MARVVITETPSGFLSVMWLGSGDQADREPYGMSYPKLETAERMGRQWAEQNGAQYIPFQPIDRSRNEREIALVKELRQNEGLSLCDAIKRARTLLA